MVGWGVEEDVEVNRRLTVTATVHVLNFSVSSAAETVSHPL